MRDMRTLVIMVLSVLLVAAVGIIGLFLSQPKKPSVLARPTTSESGIPEVATGGEAANEVRLYYLSPDQNQLEVEKRYVRMPDLIPGRVETALREWLKGPKPGNLILPVPKGAQLQNVYWSEEDRRIYVSFSEEFSPGLQSHGLAEWATIYAIVNTVMDQSPAINDVQILVNGEVISDTQSVWDWSLPFKADQTFVRHGSNGGTG